ncbi:MAG: 6,7-dimethyl-8-ribityllumazine synthase [Candidatus Krumholzibacteria bacterium]|nr:6,7-dimethyl-8-ribityllumazine synthase [Candidatus Krumholzibacteria bacterium]
MPNVHEAMMKAAKKKVAIVAGRFNDFVTGRLVSSAIDCVVRHGGNSADVDVYWVPGSFEVPQLAAKIAMDKKFDGIICVGAIIRGETNHFDNLCVAVISSIAKVSMNCSIPVTYGIVTADTAEQAMNRAGGKNGNKGWDSALALIEMMSLWES